jgi:pimeloyl-ACP methyl ester carboxylesterase
MNRPTVLPCKTFITGLALAACMASLTGCNESALTEPAEPEQILAGETLEEETLLPSPGYEPTFEYGDCQFDVLPGYEVACGDLTVPEARSQPDGRTITLHVAIFRSRSQTPEPDPFIYLTGGGGADTFRMAEWLMSSFGDAFLEERDVILYNQRGTRYNTPMLDCPGYTELNLALLRESSDGGMLSIEERSQRRIDFFLECQAELLARGMNLDAYNSAANAADASDLLVALGYEQANFYATSYGTRFALDLMRDYPEGIRTMILDSVYPPEIDYYSDYPANALYAFNLIFQECAADPECSSRYPDLERVFYQVVDDLNANPQTLAFPSGEALYLDGGGFMDVIYTRLFAPGSVAGIARSIYSASEGHYEEYEEIWYALQDAGWLSWGVWFSIQCREEVPFHSNDYRMEVASGVPSQISDYFVPMLFEPELCQSWQVSPADPIESEPVVSDVPTIVFSGRYDPITPTFWSEATAENLTNAYYYEFPNVGHGVMRSDHCALEIGLQFVDDPTTEPDTLCLRHLVARHSE